MKYRRKDGVVARSVAGENLLIPVHGCTRCVYTMNAAGCRLWEPVGGTVGGRRTLRCLVTRYGIARETAHSDVRPFLTISCAWSS